MSNKKEEQFIAIDLPGHGECIIIEAKGIHYYNATIQSKGNLELISWYLILELTKINGKMIDEQTLKGMDLCNVLKISEIISVMMGSAPTK